MWIQEYRNNLTQKQISGILKRDKIRESYDKWSDEV